MKHNNYEVCALRGTVMTRLLTVSGMDAAVEKVRWLTASSTDSAVAYVFKKIK